MRLKHNVTNYAAIFAVILSTSCLTHGADKSSSSVHKYTAEVAKLTVEPAPAPEGILMVGSSIFRRWTNCVQDLAPLPVRNRAFGGSRTEDQLFFFDQIVPSSRAALVVWYCGSNDINGKKTPEAIRQNTKEWLERTRSALPRAHILLVSVIRAPQKRTAGLLPKVDEVNKELAKLAGAFPGVAYIDVNPGLETADGAPMAANYVADNLHLTEEAYRRMTSILRPVMEKEWKAALAFKP
ncbi:MAG: GDSL-type esterase/lipase family protein [Verrucomicrobiota bacterium]